MSEPHIRNLKRFLIDLPSGLNYQLTDWAKKEIRKALFLSVSQSGVFMDRFFPKLFSENHDSDSVLWLLEDEFLWLLDNYYSKISKGRNPNQSVHTNHTHHPQLPCSRIFRRGEPIYKCLTCGFDETCALCSHCYDPKSHDGHAVHIAICQRENGGVCDCGDPEAWVQEFQCLHANDEDADLLGQSLPQELCNSFYRTMEVVLDYIIDVMCQSDLQFYSPWDVAMYPEKYSNNCSLDPRKYGYEDVDDSNYDMPSDKYSLIAYNDQVRHFRDAVQRIHLASKKVPEFATMVAERLQNHGRATVIRSRDVNLLFERQKILSATGLSSCIRNARDEFREAMCHEIILWMGSITECEFFKANQTVKDLFCKAFCSPWNKGLLTSVSNNHSEDSQGKLDSSFFISKIEYPNTQEEKSHWSFKPSPWKLPPHLCKECEYNLVADSNPENGEILSSNDEVSNGLMTANGTSDRLEVSTLEKNSVLDKGHFGSRFQYMIYLDVRFWKSIRVFLHDLYSTSLITNLTYKSIMNCQYVDIYPNIADMFLTLDGEPELNIMSTLSTQLFTCPSNSTAIIAHGDVSRFFASIHSFLRTGLIKGTDTSTETNTILMSSLKNRRWGQIFFDLGYVLSHGKAHDIFLSGNIIPMACDILSSFQGRPVMKREKESHVEYESSDYTAFFHAILVIYQYAEYIAQCITHLDPEAKRCISHNSISNIVEYLLRLESMTQDGALTDYNEVDYGQKEEAGEERKVSFLHPIHSFLSWLIEFAKLDSVEDLLGIFSSALESASYGADLKQCIITIFQYPIRTIVLSSQIKSGFWVRNGFSVRSQLQLYKHTGLREQGYMRDMYLIQVFLACSEPDVISEIFLKEWLMLDGWTNSKDSFDVPYDPNILPYIVEECLNFFMYLLTDDLYLKGLSSEETSYLKLKDEIIHNLCFGPMSFSRLCSQIPEHICSEKRFEMILEEVTVFKKQRTSKDTGSYALKEQYLDQVNPYYYNYSANKKDDAIKFVKERIHKATNKSFEEITVSPKCVNGEELGIFKFIGDFTTSPLFIDFLMKTLSYIFKEGVHKMEGLLETTLHLIHICSMECTLNVEKRGSFFEKICQTSAVFETSLAAQLYRILCEEDFKDHHAKVREIFKALDRKHYNVIGTLEQHCSDFNAKKLKLVVEETTCESESQRRKRIGKERQAKLMAKFKKQQSLFIKKNNFSTDCSDTEMEDLEEEGWKFPEAHCILCQDTAQDAGPFGIISYISKSSEFREVPFDDKYWFLKSFSDRSNLNESDEDATIPEHFSDNWKNYMKKIDDDFVIGPGFSNQRHVNSKLVSLTCGHGMHFNCYMQFLSSNKARLSQITRNTPDSAEHREFLCPLCKAINNMFIPILWTSNNRSLKQFLKPMPEANLFDHFDELVIHKEVWFNDFCRATSLDLERFSILAPTAKDMIGNNSDTLISPNQQQFRMLLSNMFQILSLLTFPQIFKADSPNVLVNSLKSTEIALRGISSSSKLLVHQISNNSLINLRALNEFRITSLLMKISNWIQLPSSKPDAHVKILANILTLSANNFNSSIIYSDFFELLVNVFPLPSTGFSFNSILRTCYCGHLIQSLHLIASQILSHDFYANDGYNILDVPYSEMITSEDANRAASLFKQLRVFPSDSNLHEHIVNHPKFGYVIYSMLLKSLTPFLRQAAIYAYVCCSNTENVNFDDIEELVFEADKLCRFLNISSFSETLSKMAANDEDGELSFEAKRFRSFVSYLKRSNGKGTSDDLAIRKTLDYPGVVRLVNLPERLDYFFTRYYYLDKYDKPHLSIENPAVCLFCSEVVDVQKNAIGSKYGQCSTHFLKECSNSVGIFLLPKERAMLLLHKNGGSFHDAPYLNQHGEVGGENKKGKTVYLLKERYEDFTKNVWLQHNIPNYIVRKLDSVIDAGGWETL